MYNGVKAKNAMTDDAKNFNSKERAAKEENEQSGETLSKPKLIH
jgi:hypothetical protein